VIDLLIIALGIIKEEDSSLVNSLVAPWSLVCRHNKHVGLGVLNIELQKVLYWSKYFMGEIGVVIIWQKGPSCLVQERILLVARYFSLTEEYRNITQYSVGNSFTI
jgi:hypothetical protein